MASKRLKRKSQPACGKLAQNRLLATLPSDYLLPNGLPKGQPNGLPNGVFIAIMFKL
jgi:hypothetical protein